MTSKAEKKVLPQRVEKELNVKLEGSENETEKEKKSSQGFEYAPSLQSTNLVTIKPRNELFINGKFIAPKSTHYLPTVNPATQEVIAQFAHGGPKDVDIAVKSARHAYDKVWSRMPGKERGRYLFRIARILQERSREFAVLETLDGGKPIRESRDIDIPLAAAHFFYHAGWADKLEYIYPGKQTEPYGVCAQVIPWNFPLLMAAWKVAPALACGNTVVLKPAETSPLTALLLGEVFQEAGLPEGVVNIVTGDGKTGKALVEHHDVNKVAFTGSTEVGKEIARAVSRSKVKLTLELGGKSAHIVFADAAMDQAVDGIVRGIYLNQGHVCSAGSRLLVEENVVDEVLVRLKKRMDTLRVGNPLYRSRLKNRLVTKSW